MIEHTYGMRKGDNYMSFASETKKELTQVDADDQSLKAELSALIRMNGSLSFANRQLSLDVQTENAAIARRLYIIVKKLYSYNVELLVRKKMRLKKINNCLGYTTIKMSRLIKRRRILLKIRFQIETLPLS